MLDIDIYLKAGDTLPTITSILKDADGIPIPLIPADQVYFVARPFGRSTVALNSLGSVVTGTAGMVRYILTPTGSPTYGTYECEWRVHFASGDVARFPNIPEFLIWEFAQTLS